MSESILVLSDVHLGSDLNDSGPSVPRSVAIDRDLAAVLAHYREERPPADRWRLVVAGDFFDFVGMAIDPQEGDSLATKLTAEERKFGLGGAEEHVRLKLRRIARRHPDVIRELGKFVADGNAVTFLHGNHDLELYWESVQEDLRGLLFEAGEDSSRGVDDRATREEFAQRVEFVPWFFYREGLAFIEHGHQYDPFCSVPYIMAPLSPCDPSRVGPTLSDTLLRYIVRRTKGIKEYGHEDRGLTSYISWGLSLGLAGTVDLFARFFQAVFKLWGTSVAYRNDGGTTVREEHWRRVEAFSKKNGFDRDRLTALQALAPPPIGFTRSGVLASVMLDRLGVFCLMVLAFAAIGIFSSHMHGWAPYVAGGLLLVWVIVHVIFSRGRGSVDPAKLMGERAGDAVKLFPASFVVMGHTHVAITKEISEASTYINVGSWAEEEPEAGADLTKVYRAPRTHLVIHERSGDHEALLCEWSDGAPRLKSKVVRPKSSEEPDVQRAAE